MRRENPAIVKSLWGSKCQCPHRA